VTRGGEGDIETGTKKWPLSPFFEQTLEKGEENRGRKDRGLLNKGPEKKMCLHSRRGVKGLGGGGNNAKGKGQEA